MVKRDVYMSGEKAAVSGTFDVINHSPSHPQQVTVEKGKEFPRCPSCSQTVKYKLSAK